MGADREDWIRRFLRVAIGLALVSPYLIWLAAVSEWSVPSASEWWSPLWNSLEQALVSTFCALVGGVFLFHALQSCRSSRAQGRAELFLLLPNMIPPLFIALGLFGLLGSREKFPFGFGMVVLAHAFMNAGLVAIALDRMIRLRVAGQAEVAWITGAGRLRFWLQIAWPQLVTDLGCLALLVFAFCFTSFSIPLLVGGSRAYSLEVLIYDLIREDGRWDLAVVLGGVQSLFLLAIAWVLPPGHWPDRPRGPVARLDWLGFPGGAWLVPVLPVLLALGWLRGFSRDGAGAVFQRLIADHGVLSALPEAIVTSLMVGLGTGLIILVLSLAVAYVSPHRGLERFLYGYLAPSSAITAFGFLLLPDVTTGSGGDDHPIYLMCALALIAFSALYRWMIHSALASLARQIEVSRVMGATWRMIFEEIVWPQSADVFLKSSGLAAVWACGDFALSGVMLNRSGGTLPLLTEDLLFNFRFAEAALLILPQICIALVLYTFFARSVRYVAG